MGQEKRFQQSWERAELASSQLQALTAKYTQILAERSERYYNQWEKVSEVGGRGRPWGQGALGIGLFFL